ncbi:MAG: hypothetical protein GX595_18190 [Lentisphaerae bacterium]|nr:hypothetical protein [Lentisphaerota bacterium]
MSDDSKVVIFFICNHGFAHDAMAAARAAGARGGTILHGRSSVGGEKARFFGITVHPEKDILMIVCLADQQVALMQALVAGYGPASEAGGLCFSMPVDETLGFTFGPAAAAEPS